MINYTPGEMPAFELIFINAGRTSATSVDIAADMRGSQQPFSGRLAIGAGYVVKNVSIAGGQTKHFFIYPGKVITKSDIDRFEANTAYLQVHGWFSYSDRFGNKYPVEDFCSRYFILRNKPADWPQFGRCE